MTDRRCPDCEGELIPINVVDQMGQGRTAVGFPYTVGDPPKTGLWSGKVKNSTGVVHAVLCTDCNRVLLYAQPGA